MDIVAPQQDITVQISDKEKQKRFDLAGVKVLVPKKVDLSISEEHSHSPSNNKTVSKFEGLDMHLLAEKKYKQVGGGAGVVGSSIKRHSSIPERELRETSFQQSATTDRKQSHSPFNIPTVSNSPVPNSLYDNAELLYELYEGPLTHMLMPQDGETQGEGEPQLIKGGRLSLPPLKRGSMGFRNECYSRITHNEKIELYLRNPALADTHSSVGEAAVVRPIAATSLKPKKKKKRRASSPKKNTSNGNCLETVSSVAAEQSRVESNRYGLESQTNRTTRKEPQK